MKKLNQHYFTVAVYAFAVIAFSLLFLMLCINFGVITSGVGNFLSAISSILYAILFAFLLFPAVKRFDLLYEKILAKKKPHPYLVSGFSIATTVILALGILVALLIVIIPRLVRDAGDLYAYVMDIKLQLDTFVAQNAEAHPMLADLYRAATNFLIGEGSSLLSGAISSLTGIFSAVIGQVSSIFMGLIIAVYLLATRRVISGITGKLALIPERFVNRFVLFFKRLYTDFSAFSFNRLLIAFIFSTAVFFLCLLLRVPLLSMVVLLILLSHLIPVVGPIIGTSLSIALVFILKGPWGFVYAAVVLALEVLFTSVLLPHMLPKKLRPSYGVTAMMVLLSLALFGVIGAFVAVPLYATLSVEIRRLIVHRLAGKKLPVSTGAYEAFDATAYESAMRASAEEPEKETEESQPEP